MCLLTEENWVDTKQTTDKNDPRTVLLDRGICTRCSNAIRVVARAYAGAVVSLKYFLQSLLISMSKRSELVLMTGHGCHLVQLSQVRFRTQHASCGGQKHTSLRVPLQKTQKNTHSCKLHPIHSFRQEHTHLLGLQKEVTALHADITGPADRVFTKVHINLQCLTCNFSRNQSLLPDNELTPNITN